MIEESEAGERKRAGARKLDALLGYCESTASAAASACSTISARRTQAPAATATTA
jgi:phytoene/squalene synthetase